ncbi:MAG TPA: ABC transporter ATP-binding protein [Myxococcota bacterium]|nr:ABC transporter ATP-binding protein [Myxococcota bacterium]
MSAKIEAQNVSKRFGSLVALDALSLEVAAGEVFGIIGPNGAGKTTFLRILTGYWLASEGDVRVDGLSVTRQRFQVQARLGYACEQPKLYTDHRVDAFLRLMGEIRGLSGARLREAIALAADRLGLGPVMKRRLGVLSKGFRQRVALAQALLHEPALLVVDEPTVGLDPAQQIELRRIIAGFRGQHTVILCTHQLHEAEMICDRVALLDRGQLAALATAEDIRAGGSLEELFLAKVGTHSAVAP